MRNTWGTKRIREYSGYLYMTKGGGGQTGLYGRFRSEEAANRVNPIADELRDMAELLFCELGRLPLGISDEYVITIKPRLSPSDLQYVADLVVVEGSYEPRPIRGINVRCESCGFSKRHKRGGLRCYLPEPLGIAGGRDAPQEICEQYTWDHQTRSGKSKAITAEESK